MFNSRSSISISTFLSSLIGSIMRGRRSVRCGQTCEYRKARLILTHDPGEELFLGALHPAAALFREHIDIPELIAEHATYRKVLEEAGARYSRYVRSCSTEPARTGNPPTGRSWRTCAASRPVFLPSTPKTSLRKQPSSKRSTDNPSSPRHRPRDLVRIILRQPIIDCRKRRSTRGSRPNIRKTP